MGSSISAVPTGLAMILLRVLSSELLGYYRLGYYRRSIRDPA